MKPILIKNATIINEGESFINDVLIENGLFEKIDRDLSHPTATVIDAQNLILLPGVIDDQVHFREPGLTHKGTIYSEAKAAVAGGITSYMEMPNTKPQTVSRVDLEKKYNRAQQCSLANYSFFMGGTNDNLDEVLKVNYNNVCGLKLFMGSSTGNMLVNDTKVLENIFLKFPHLIATHCEDDVMIKENQTRMIEIYGNNIPAYFHPIIRNDEACFKSSSYAVQLAKKHGTRLHVLHISTAKELKLFENKTPLKNKKITAEACIHHLWFNDEDYKTHGNFIKWNPAIKTEYDRQQIFDAMLDGTIDVVATDHAPHTLEEKNAPYLNAPSGGPLVQHALLAMLEFYHQKKITLDQIATKMAHNVADIFQITNRGYIKEGFAADLVLVNLNKPMVVSNQNVLYHCGWTPFDNTTFKSSIEKTFVNGHLVYNNGMFDETQMGQRLLFNCKG